MGCSQGELIATGEPLIRKLIPSEAYMTGTIDAPFIKVKRSYKAPQEGFESWVNVNYTRTILGGALAKCMYKLSTQANSKVGVCASMDCVNQSC